ncbi:MAG: hypothetical protein RQ741_05890 [Wenzhouxiangellaceae bacterium]|nr:hypothetical protein [Wenzhouxiangellaceae bacterium]
MLPIVLWALLGWNSAVVEAQADDLQAVDLPDLEKALEQHELGLIRAWLDSLDGERGPTADELRARAWLAHHDGQIRRANQLIDQAVELRPERPDLRLDRSRLRSAMLDDVGVFKALRIARRVREDLENAFEADPENVAVLRALMVFHRKAPAIAGGDDQRARQLGEHLDRLAPAHAGFDRARRLAAQDRPGQALKELAVAIDQAGSVPLEWRSLHASLLRQRQCFDEALAVLDAMLAESPAFGPAWYELGLISDHSGRHTRRGIEALGRYLELPYWPGDPDPAQAWWQLGKLYQRAGQWAQAVQARARALQLDPDLADA